MTKNGEDSGEEEILEVVILNLRNLFDNLSNSLDGIRSRSLALLGGEIAIISFLFSTTDGFLPVNSDSIVFMALGLALVSIAFILLLYVLHPTKWMCPPDTNDTADLSERFDNDKLKFLRYLKIQYEQSITVAGKAIERKSNSFAWALKLVAIGIVILLVIKYL